MSCYLIKATNYRLMDTNQTRHIMKFFATLLVVIISTMIFSASSPQADALLCDNANMKSLYNQKDTVFQGKAIHKEYIPLSEDVLVTFEIQTIFKGEPPNPITVSSKEGFYGYKIQEDHTYLIFADKNPTGYDIPLCTPTFYAFPSLVEIIQSVKDGDKSADEITWGDMYENHLSEQEKEELEKITAQGKKMHNKEHGERRLTSDIIFVGIAGATASIPIGIVWQVRKNKGKEK